MIGLVAFNNRFHFSLSQKDECYQSSNVSDCEASLGVAVDLIEVFENHLWIR